MQYLSSKGNPDDMTTVQVMWDIAEKDRKVMLLHQQRVCAVRVKKKGGRMQTLHLQSRGKLLWPKIAISTNGEIDLRLGPLENSVYTLKHLYRVERLMEHIGSIW
jgi:hypothetical protein